MNHEAESTDAPARGGLLRLSVEAGVMPAEQRERVTRTDLSQRATGGTRLQGKTAVFYEWHEPDKPRGLRPVLWAARGETPRADAARW